MTVNVFNAPSIYIQNHCATKIILEYQLQQLLYNSPQKKKIIYTILGCQSLFAIHCISIRFWFLDHVHVVSRGFYLA